METKIVVLENICIGLDFLVLYIAINSGTTDRNASSWPEFEVCTIAEKSYQLNLVFQPNKYIYI